MEFGDIVYFKNIIFKNEDGSHIIDPYFSIGRPCVCIGEYDGYMYFLPLTRIDDRRDEKYFDIVINPDKQNKLQKVSKINYTNIVKKPVSFFEVKGRISKKEIYEILKKSLTLYKCECFDYSDIVTKIMVNYSKKENIILLEKKNNEKLAEKEILSIGDIVLLKQIIFSDRDKSFVDHSFGSGRPCVYVGSKDGQMYFFSLNGFNPKIKDYLTILNPNKENKLKKTSGICVNEIFCMPSQTLQTIGNIGEKKVLTLLKKYILYYNNKRDSLINKEHFETVFQLFNDEIMLENDKKIKNLKK